MKRFAYIFIISGLLLVVTNSCHNNPIFESTNTSNNLVLISDPVLTVEPGTGANLIVNPFFEKGGIPSLEGWRFQDTSKAKVVSDSPFQNIKYSMGLEKDGGLAELYVSSKSGHYIYTLSFWGKNSKDCFNFFDLVQTRDNSGEISSVGGYNNTSTWKRFTLTDTVDIRSTDKIWISFEASPNPQQWTMLSK